MALANGTGISRYMGTGGYGQYRVCGFWQDALWPGLMRSGRLWEPHIAAALYSLLKPGDAFVDAGGNVGVHTLLAGTLVGESGSVVTFEAHPLNARALRRSVKLNGLAARVTVHSVAVGARRSRVCLPRTALDERFSESKHGDVAQMEFMVKDRAAHGSCGANEQEVPLETLDSFELPRVDVIKADIQGSELEFFKGGEATLRRHRPVLIYEMEDGLLQRFGGATSSTVVEWLNALGYHVFLLAEKFPSDHMAVPSEKLDALKGALGARAAFRPMRTRANMNFNSEAGVREEVCMSTPDIPSLRPLKQTVECGMHPAYKRRPGQLQKWPPREQPPARPGSAGALAARRQRATQPSAPQQQAAEGAAAPRPAELPPRASGQHVVHVDRLGGAGVGTTGPFAGVNEQDCGHLPSPARLGCTLLLGSDFQCGQVATARSCAFSNPSAAKQRCAREPRCLLSVRDGAWSTLKAEFNWTLGRRVVPATAEKCEELVRQMRVKPTQQLARRGRSLGCLDISSGHAFCCRTEACARRVLSAPRDRPGLAVEVPARPPTLQRARRPCPPGRRNAVLAAAWGYGAPVLRPFMRSFHEAGLGNSTQGLLLIREGSLADAELKANAKAWGFWMLLADRDYAYTARVVDELGLDVGCGGLAIPATGRYFEYEAVLLAFGRCFDTVLITDTRDAYFQADPFAHMPRDGGFYSFREQVRERSPCCSLQSNPFASLWNDRIGEFLRLERPLNEELREMASGGQNTPVVCSGVSGGALGSVLAWLRAMMGLLVRLGRAPIKYEGANPFDQGLHNYVLYKRLFEGNITLPSNEHGPVFHNVCWQPEWTQAGLPGNMLGLNAAPEHATDPIGQLKNGKRTMIAAIVHQYDRCTQLNARVLAHFNRPPDGRPAAAGGAPGDLARVKRW